MNYPIYDLEREFNEQARPHLDKLVEVCRRLGVPFLIGCVYATREDGVVGAHIAACGRKQDDDWAPENMTAALDVLEGKAELAYAMSPFPLGVPVSIDELMGWLGEYQEEDDQGPQTQD